MVLLLKEDEVAGLITLPDAIKCIEKAFKQESEGGIQGGLSAFMRSDGTNLLIRGAGLVDEHRLVLRASSVGSRAMAFVWDSPHGDLAAILEYPFSNLRVSACMGLAMDRLCPAEVKTAAVIGTGVVAWQSLVGVASVRSLTEVQVYSPNETHREAFAARAWSSLGIKAIPQKEPRDTLAGAELVLVATTSNEATIQADWLTSTCVIASAGTRQEVGPDVYERADCIVMGSKAIEKTNDWHVTQGIRDGRLSWDQIIDLGELVTGKREVLPGFIAFREAQAGFCDAALVALAIDQATKAGKGTQWELEPTTRRSRT
jgi:alanine dehydrogenase